MNASLRRTGLDLDQDLWLQQVAPFGLVEVRGPDAGEFLHRLCSQDVLGLAVGGAAPAAFLNAKGKLLVTAWVVRLDDRFLLETAAHQVAELAELLERYHFSEKLTVTTLADLACTALYGTRAARVLGMRSGQAKALGARGVTIASTWHALTTVRVHAAPGDALPFQGGGFPELTQEHGDLLRIASGRVKVGTDTDATTLAPEAGLEAALSATKGCYTGQEIVARIGTYGHVNRKLCVVELATAQEPALGTALCELEEGDAVGRVFSSALCSDRVHRLALAYLPKDFWTPGIPLALGTRNGPRAQVLDFGEASASAT